jgi:hypothetical protein
VAGDLTAVGIRERTVVVDESSTLGDNRGGTGTLVFLTEDGGESGLGLVATKVFSAAIGDLRISFRGLVAAAVDELLEGTGIKDGEAGLLCVEITRLAGGDASRTEPSLHGGLGGGVFLLVVVVVALTSPLALVWDGDFVAGGLLFTGL